MPPCLLRNYVARDRVDRKPPPHDLLHALYSRPSNFGPRRAGGQETGCPIQYTPLANLDRTWNPHALKRVRVLHSELVE